jgi:hypothetical protein
VLYYEEGNVQVSKKATVKAKEYDINTNTYGYSVPIKSDYLKNKQSISLKITHWTQIYETVIPYKAIIPGAENRNYIYITKQRQGLFGPEYYSKLLEVEIIDSNDFYAALGGWAITVYDDIILSSSIYLISGETVKVINK